METIRCDHFERWNLQLDGTGFYVVIKPDFSDGLIHVVIKQDIEDKPVIEFVGLQAQNIYHEIFEYEKRNGLQWFQEKTHIAYLGKELKKAELALTLGSSYYQE